VSSLALREEILQRLTAAPNGIENVVEHLEERLGTRPGFYNVLLDLVAGVQLDADQARRVIQQSKKHRLALESELMRPVDFRTAILDYLTVEEPLLKSPKIIEMKLYADKLRYGMVDELTGLYNRRSMFEFAKREIARSSRYDLQMSILLMDLDNFKEVNDNHGHRVGDEVLKGFARLIMQHARHEDVPVRYGGEEFVIVMPQTDTGGAYRLGFRLLKTMQTGSCCADVPIGFSGGVATYPDHSRNLEELIEVADRTLYLVKNTGKSDVQVARSDKRRSKRHPAAFRLLYSLGGGPVSTGVTHDISEHGLAFETERPLRLGETFTLNIHSRFEHRNYTLRARLIWRTSEGPEGAYRFGAEYENPSQVPVKRLLRVANTA
jgi:diguanylate cyclase (GGDEF)-like protein